MNSGDDTIFAMASGGLPAGIAVIRVSGPKAFAIAERLSGQLPEPRRAVLRDIRNHSGEVIDRGLVLAFPGPQSFTGEDCIELQLHGSRAVVKAISETLAGFPDTRLAEAGEFSRRAFENDRLDLVEVEGLADLLSAETEMQRKLAMEQASGHLSEIYSGWRNKLLFARSMIEAELDFSDEGDIPGAISDKIWGDVASIHSELSVAIRQLRAGEIIRDGFKVAIVGRPNAGKSSLLNALASRDVAIVTEHAGTTRDVIRAELDIGGYRVELFDTAGIRETVEPIEAEGIRRAAQVAEQANLVLMLSEPKTDDPLQLEPAPTRVIHVRTKSDLDSSSKRADEISVSVKSGEGLTTLRSLILEQVQIATTTNSLAIPSRLRHLQHLQQAELELDQVLKNQDLPLEIKAEHLRSASEALSRVTGRIDVEMLLGKIFSEFCVGK